MNLNSVVDDAILHLTRLKEWYGSTFGLAGWLIAIFFALYVLARVMDSPRFKG
ncbi:Uncharacterised protein [uncultured archaeon]|nr:Uncharacterised protein [uncultured archaeon]